MARVRVSQHVVEVLVPTDTRNPTTVTGCGVSQLVVEVLGSFPGKMRVSQHVVEVLMADDDTQSDPSGGSGPGGAVTHVYGYAV